MRAGTAVAFIQSKTKAWNLASHFNRNECRAYRRGHQVHSDKTFELAGR